MSAILDAVSALSFANEVRKAQSEQMPERPMTPEEQQYNDLVQSAGVVRNVPKVGTALGLLNDYQISQMEKANPSLGPKDPFSPEARNRFSTVGQVLFGAGYPTQPGIPEVSLVDRIYGSLGGDVAPNPATTMFNARGNIFTNVVPRPQPQPQPQAQSTRSGGDDGGSEGWETSGRGEGNTYNFGGRESAIDNRDFSGYA